VAGLTEKFSGQQIFGTVTAVALIFALLLALLVRPIKRMMARP